ncbi:MAG: aminotransferase class I/II-fold pyridoxal phosphate-dependent enzyme [Saprospiraceae bacterium]|nr:aminotransferase class I/II-fold pyridoxal phosphate-dependent enzyme [Saprospiraceae bacterium]
MKIEVASRVGQVEEYYFSRKLREIAHMRAEGMDIINLGIGSPDRMPSPQVIQRLCEESAKDDQHGYQSYAGIMPLKKAFANWCQDRFALELDPGTEILPLIGSKEGIMHISMTYLEAGDEVLVPDPGYPTYQSAALLTGASVRKYHLSSAEGWQPNLERLAQEDLSRVKIMWVNYPHMPTGARADSGTFAALVKFGIDKDILICHDNPYAFILNDQPQSLLAVPGAKEVVIELHSLSKTFNMAGWRVGFLAGARERIHEVLRFKSNMDSGMFKPLQLAAAEALGLSTDWYEDLNKVYRSRRQLAEELLTNLGCRFDRDQVGMFVWARIPNEYDDGRAMADRILEEAHTFITPGSIFGQGGSKYVRVSLCSTEEVFSEAIRRCAIVSKPKVDLP